MRRTLLAFLAGLALAAGGLAAWRYLHGTVRGGEVVDDIRPLNRLVVLRAYLTSVTTTHEVGWFTHTDQTMITPAYVNYYIDMSAIGPRMVEVKGGDVFVALPPLMIERPNIDTAHILTFNAGLWSYLSSTSDGLRIRNNGKAQVQLLQRARMPFLVAAARDAAVKAVGADVQTALAADGHRDLRIHVIE